jgi:putative ABC transport system permease protein
MEIKETLQAAFYSLRTHKMRSALTMLGIIIGIASVVLITSIGNGQMKVMNKAYKKSGFTRCRIRINKHYIKNSGITDSDEFNQSDIDKIKKLPFIEHAEVMRVIHPPYIKLLNKNALISNKRKVRSIEGCGIDLFEMYQRKALRGRNIRDNEKDNVCVIDNLLAHELFGSADKALGQAVNVAINEPGKYHGIYSFIVVGVGKNMYAEIAKVINKNDLPYDTISRITIPTLQFQKITGEKHNSSFVCDFKEGLDYRKVGDELISYISRMKGLPKAAFTFINEDDMIMMKQSNVQESNNSISLIAAVSLIVAGIGLMAVMIVTVKERTKEIGIRKALGAAYTDIIFQFLTEAVTLSLIGGILGVIFGIAASYIIGIFTDIPPIPDILVIIGSFIVSVIIGVVFGIYPAIQAAKLNPVEALRHE